MPYLNTFSILGVCSRLKGRWPRRLSGSAAANTTSSVPAGTASRPNNGRPIRGEKPLAIAIALCHIFWTRRKFIKHPCNCSVLLFFCLICKQWIKIEVKHEASEAATYKPPPSEKIWAICHQPRGSINGGGREDETYANVTPRRFDRESRRWTLNGDHSVTQEIQLWCEASDSQPRVIVRSRLPRDSTLAMVRKSCGWMVNRQNKLGTSWWCWICGHSGFWRNKMSCKRVKMCNDNKKYPNKLTTHNVNIN